MTTRLFLTASCLLALISGCSEPTAPVETAPVVTTETPKAAPGARSATPPTPSGTSQKQSD